MDVSGCRLVFVHGLWMTGRESLFLRHELKALLNADIRVFAYRSVVDPLGRNARALLDFLNLIDGGPVHLVGHSLGGLVILRCLEEDSWKAPGRAVLLGTPVQGSYVARELARVPLLRPLIGRGMLESMLPPTQPRRWIGRRELGVIAGDVPLGLGRLAGPLGAPNDGTVLVAETRLEGAADSIVLPVSHSGMMFSRAVARQTAQFLRQGRFSR